MLQEIYLKDNLLRKFIKMEDIIGVMLEMEKETVMELFTIEMEDTIKVIGSKI